MYKTRAARLSIAATAGAAFFAFGATAPAVADAHGANDACPGHSYCPTEQGISMNGNKPHPNHDAGSKGKADSKNPPGQFKDGSDANNGYECDGNNGIALGNPAHTGCSGPIS